MGRGNYLPPNTPRYVWYIDYDTFCCDDDVDPLAYKYAVARLFKAIESQYKFTPVSKWGDRYWAEHIFGENKLFRIGTADNEWSVAVYIEGRPEYEGLARRNLVAYINGISKIMIDQFGDVCTWGGAWCSAPLKEHISELPAWSK